MKKCIKLLSLLFIVNCNTVVNTWEPKASTSILESKKNGFYINQYDLSNDSLCSLIEEVWVENCWKNIDEIKNDKIQTVKINNCLQLVLKLNVNNKSVKMKNYFINWEFKCLPKELFISSGIFDGMCTFDLKSNEIPKNLIIKLVNNGDTLNNCCFYKFKTTFSPCYVTSP